MIVASDDLIDWVADRGSLLIAAWAPQVAAALAWDLAVAEAFASELHEAMLTTMLRRGTEIDFLGLVNRPKAGLDAPVERALAERFFMVSLNLARAASRHRREERGRRVLPFKRGVVVGDSRTDPSHLPLSRVLLPWDHPFWARWQPPFGMVCRCGTISMTRSQLARSRRSITSDAELASIATELRDTWPAEFLPLLDFRGA